MIAGVDRRPLADAVLDVRRLGTIATADRMGLDPTAALDTFRITKLASTFADAGARCRCVLVLTDL